MTIQPIYSLLEQDLSSVNNIIRKHLQSKVGLISQVAEHIIGSGGKRLRPILLILTAKACRYEGSHHHLLSAIIELIHTATLLHDDVVDESSLRRGQATANARFGNPASVLVGDFLYSRAFQMMVSVEQMRVLQILSDTTNVIAEGEVLQLLNTGNPDLNEADYLQVIRCKTAKLFEAATRLGAVLGGTPQELEDALASFGMHIGTAFQLIDDVLDYSGDYQQIGKNLGDDLAEGKATLPLIYALKTVSREAATELRHAVTEGRLLEFDPVLSIIKDSGALAYTRQRAEAEIVLAKQYLAELSDSKYKDSLLELARFAVTRNY